MRKLYIRVYVNLYTVIPMPYRNKEDMAAYMRKRRARKKEQANLDKRELHVHRVKAVASTKKLGKRRFATDSAGSMEGRSYPASGVKHYVASAEDEEEASRERCIQGYIEEGMTREEAKEACKEHKKEPAPASDVKPEDIYTGLDRCIQCRMLDETEDVARKYCLQMFTDPEIKAAFENDAPSEVIARLWLDWDRKYHPSQKSWREFQASREHGKELTVKAKMDELSKHQSFLLESDLRREAEKQVAIDREKQKRENTHQDRLTVGSTFGKTKAQIIAEDSGQKGRTTVGSLYGKSRAEILAASQPEQTPMERCIKGRMDRGESYKEALAWCKIELEVK